MNDSNRELSRQLDAAYRDGGTFGRLLAGVALAVALVALFIYRAATTDPLWEAERAAAEAKAEAGK